ncbi:MAG: TetR family transcriptional regulator [Burkholderiaceae bacterium]|nr:TetR/AcrR family transcriptional regulator [Rhodoferax sp.]MCB2042833.1 TetR/AcrR family transcriptional regulator [Rhodoferax sp.]
MAGESTLDASEPLTDTAIQILDVAERLFASNGIDKVSLREIVRASGQANLSAAHYHFGSREALIGALLARRIRTINVIRHRRMDELEAAGLGGDVYAIASTSVSVLGDVVKDMPWGPDYVRVVAQALFSHNRDVWRHLDPATMSGHTRVRDMLRRALPGLSPRAFKDRIWMLNNHATYGIARWVQTHGPVTPANSRRFAAMIRHTSDFLAAGMGAPVGNPGHEHGALRAGPSA